MKRTRNQTASKSAARPANDLDIGARLRAVRATVGFTQRELAKRAGVTNSTISLMEQEAHSPSIASLHRVLSAIPISMADFFAPPTSQKNVLFYDSHELAVVARGESDLRVLGAERRDKQLQLFIERYQPGASTGDEPLAHDGETAAVVLSGTVEITVDGMVRVLRRGGGYQLFGRQPYTLRNVGRTVAVVACACTPPMF